MTGKQMPRFVSLGISQSGSCCDSVTVCARQLARPKASNAALAAHNAPWLACVWYTNISGIGRFECNCDTSETTNTHDTHGVYAIAHGTLHESNRIESVRLNDRPCIKFEFECCAQTVSETDIEIAFETEFEVGRAEAVKCQKQNTSETKNEKRNKERDREINTR